MTNERKDDAISCPQCGSEDVRANSDANIASSVSYNANTGEIEYGPYNTEDVDFLGGVSLYCRDCGHASDGFKDLSHDRLIAEGWMRPGAREGAKAKLNDTLTNALASNELSPEEVRQVVEAVLGRDA